MDNYLGEIRLFAGNFAPINWLLCDGQILRISDYQQLYSLIGAQYGGDGNITFALPDLRGRIPVGQGQGVGLSAYTIGQKGGQENVTLADADIPSHTHKVAALDTAGTSPLPQNQIFAQPSNGFVGYLPPGTTDPKIHPLQASTIAPTGLSVAHENRMFSTAISFIIATAGIYPSRT